MFSPQPSRHLRPFAGLLLIWLAHLAIAPARAYAYDLNGAMDQFAGRIKELLEAERESEIALNQFHAPARLVANSSSGIRKALEECLKKRGVQVKNTARLEINGEYREVDD